MAKPRLGSNAIFSGAQKGLTILSDRCYGYTGVVTVGNETVECLRFATGKGVIVAKVYLAYDVNDFTAGEKIGYEMLFNGQMLINSVYGANLRPTGNSYVMDFIIPPLTEVRFNFVNTDASGVPMSMVLSGRVYDA